MNTLIRRYPFRRSILKCIDALPVVMLLAAGSHQLPADESTGRLVAYVGTFSSPLRDTLPTQVDLPPGNGRGIHIFEVIRSSGTLNPIGVYELGTSPSHLAVNASGTRLYSSNETDRVGKSKQGTVSSFAIDESDGSLQLLNTVVSGGAGPTYVSLHPSGRFLFAATTLAGPFRSCQFRQTGGWARRPTSRMILARSDRPKQQMRPLEALRSAGMMAPTLT